MPLYLHGPTGLCVTGVATIQYLLVNQNFGISYCAFGLLTVLFSDVTRRLSADSLLVLVSINGI